MVKQQYEIGCPIQETFGEWIIANKDISIKDSVLMIRSMEKQANSGKWLLWIVEELYRRIGYLKNGIVDKLERKN